MSENNGRKVIAHVAMSLDGRVREPGGGMDWIFAHAVDAETAAHFAGIWGGASTVLLGRTNFEGYQAVWPAVAKNPDNGWFPPETAPRHHAFAVWLDEVEKVVFSRTLTETTWENSRVAEREPADEVRALRAAGGGHIIVLASVSVIQELMRAELVDQLRLTIVPAVIGGDELRLFSDDLPASKWETGSLTTFPGGAIALRYDRR
jgi:dihydrofolate reductase